MSKSELKECPLRCGGTVSTATDANRPEGVVYCGGKHCKMNPVNGGPVLPRGIWQLLSRRFKSGELAKIIGEMDNLIESMDNAWTGEDEDLCQWIGDLKHLRERLSSLPDCGKCDRLKKLEKKLRSEQKELVHYQAENLRLIEGRASSGDKTKVEKLELGINNLGGMLQVENGGQISRAWVAGQLRDILDSVVETIDGKTCEQSDSATCDNCADTGCDLNPAKPVPSNNCGNESSIIGASGRCDFDGECEECPQWTGDRCHDVIDPTKPIPEPSGSKALRGAKDLHQSMRVRPSSDVNIVRLWKVIEKMLDHLDENEKRK